MKKRTILILLLILTVAAVLRFYRLNQHDVITDEVFYGYRSIGMIDSLDSPYQSTPFEWFQNVPWWAHLSFHDHPPLGFWIEHLFFLAGGVNLWALRLPFVLAGLASILLTFFIAKRLWRDDAPALLAAGILAVNQYHLWISRIGLQESLVIFFMLAAILLFLKFLENPRWFYPTVVAVGIALLMKYTAVALLPIFLGYLFWKRRDLLSGRRLLGGTLLLVALLAPVWIYNLELYRATHHFDFQISYFLGERVTEWQIRPGREVGGVTQRLGHFFKNFWDDYGIVYTLLTAAGLGFLFARRRSAPAQFIALVLALLFLLFLLIGPQERFLAMLAPFLAMAVAGAAWWLGARWRGAYYLFGFLLLLEALFAINTNLLAKPIGREGLTYSLLGRESALWGYNQVEQYFLQTTAGTYPKETFPVRFQFVRDLQAEALARARQEGKQPVMTLFVVDSRFHGPAFLWYVTRHTVYERWPIIEDSTFLNSVKDDQNFFTKQGFSKFVYIKGADTLLRSDVNPEFPREMEDTLVKNGIQPRVIISPAGRAAFKIYEF